MSSSPRPTLIALALALLVLLPGCDGASSRGERWIDEHGASSDPLVARSDGEVLALIVAEPGCEITRAYLGELVRLRERLEAAGGRLLLVEMGDGRKPTLATEGLPVLRRPDENLIRVAWGVKAFPQAVVLRLRAGGGWSVCYSGRFDDRYTPGDPGSAALLRPEAEHDYLGDAVDAALDGQMLRVGDLGGPAVREDLPAPP